MTQRLTLTIDGMHCASCVGRAEAALLQVSGVETAAVNLANGSAHINGTSLNGPVLAQRLEQIGFAAQVQHDPLRRVDRHAEVAAVWRKFQIALILTLPVFLAEMGGHLYPPVHHMIMTTLEQTSWGIVQFALITLVLLWPGRAFFIECWASFKRRAPDMNALVALGAGAAWFYSTIVVFASDLIPEGSRSLYFEAAGVIVTLILLGRALEGRAKGQASAAIEALITLQPGTSLVDRDGAWVEEPIASICVGDVLLAQPGARIAVDGEVVSGNGLVNEAMMSGEPLPVAKAPGDAVTAGTLNETGALRYTALAVGSDTALARIVQMVDRAQSTKLPVQAKIDKVTGFFVPVVIALAVLSVAGWLLFGGTLAQALVAGVSVLIIACPCAMGLATPVSVVVATGRAARQGIIFRGGAALEKLGTIRTVAFDKTGTLTAGTPQVAPSSLPTDKALLRQIAAVEAQSEHPIARALAGISDGPLPDISNFQAVPGLGASAIAEGVAILVGSARFMEREGVSINHLAQQETELMNIAATPVFVARDGTAVAVLGISDPVKNGANEALGELSGSGVRLAMVSGDRREVADKVAAQLGISHVVAEVLPADKADTVTELQTYGPVAFVGDGINDAPALAEADVGIAMGSGTDVAIEAADIVVPGDDLGAVPRALTISAAANRNIRQNLFWAFAYNAALIPVAMGVFYPLLGWQLSPALAAGAMALSSVFVVTNALRLARA